MGTIELLILAVGLSMDAFAVSVCKGLAMGKPTWRQAAVPGLWFGGFQGLMPCVGYLLGARFSACITAIDHWIAFGLLAVLGINMLREAREGPEAADGSLAWKPMLAMAVATSIDALAVGITFAFLAVRGAARPRPWGGSSSSSWGGRSCWSTPGICPFDLFSRDTKGDTP